MVAEPLPREPDPVAPDSFEASQSGLQLLIFRLSAQERAATRMRSRAERYMALALAFLGFHIGILVAADATLPAWGWAGAFIIAGLFLLAGALFLVVHWPASLLTAPEPGYINERTWYEGRAAVWTWSYALQDAFEANRARIQRNSRLNGAILAVVVVEALSFLGFTFAMLWV